MMNRVNLFGSAMNVKLWNDFLDVSDIRPVPDHQEVYMHKEFPISLIIELNEHDNDVYEEYGPARDYFPNHSDSEEKGLFNILLYNLHEYAQDKSDTALPILKVRKVERLNPDEVLDHLWDENANGCRESMAGFIEADVGSDSSRLTRISLVLIWLKSFNTQILIILNKEICGGNSDTLLFDVMQVASSLKIVDTNLFIA